MAKQNMIIHLEPEQKSAVQARANENDQTITVIDQLDDDIDGK